MKRSRFSDEQIILAEPYAALLKDQDRRAAQGSPVRLRHTL
jgi:hypothetical protein